MSLSKNFNRCWYRKGMNEYFSNLGYVHFVTKDGVFSDYKDGIAYYFDDVSKEFGKLDLISRDRNDEAIENADKIVAEMNKLNSEETNPIEDYSNSVRWCSIDCKVELVYITGILNLSGDPNPPSTDNPSYVCEVLNGNRKCIRKHSQLQPLECREDFDAMIDAKNKAAIRKAKETLEIFKDLI